MRYQSNSTQMIFLTAGRKRNIIAGDREGINMPSQSDTNDGKLDGVCPPM